MYLSCADETVKQRILMQLSKISHSVENFGRLLSLASDYSVLPLDRSELFEYFFSCKCKYHEKFDLRNVS